ncbi:MAG: helicase-exonuclease AddAB subunit AddB [Lachnospiraceae bacterium]|nr:helicase-exonuclease AddAB subunit AddB [Lachnospiraceae bacterium]
MKLQLVYGASGSGKTEYVFNEIVKASCDCVEDSFVIIVPEQFTMETQKNIITRHPNGGTMNIDIQSFIRLAGNIFDELGVNTGTILDDTGKSLILRNVVEKEKDLLEIFGGKINKPGFIEELKSTISEFYQYGIDKEELDSLINNSELKPLLRAKLKDVAIIFSAFEKYIGQDYIPSEELLKVLCQYIEESEIVKNSEFYIDGFTGFTPIQYEVLEKLIKCSKKVTVTLTLPSYKVNETRELEQDLFLMSVKTKNKLLRLATELGADICKPVIMDDKEPIRFKNSGMLSFLEKNIFRYSKAEYENNENDIEIFAAQNPKDEVANVVLRIKELVRSDNYRYNEIAVVTGDIESYYRLIEKEFANADIPCFVDNKKSIITNPFVEAIRGIIQMIEEDFSYESIFRYLRTGMSNLTIEEVDVLENQVLAMGIRGYKKWSCEWYDVSDKINDIRQRIVEDFEPLKLGLGKGKYKVKHICTVLYEFISATKMEDKLNRYLNKFEEDNSLDLVKEYSQVYAYVMDLFDKIVSLMGNEELKLSEFADILDSGFEEIEVGVIPMSVDSVVAGDIQRTRLSNVKALFFIGVNDGIVPKVSATGGILNETDRNNLSKVDIELAPSAKENAFIQKFYLYLNMTKPKNKLIISYSVTDGSGKALRASYLINEVSKLFANFSVKSTMNNNDLSFVTSENAVINYLADELREMPKDTEVADMDNVFKELFARFYGDEKYRDTMDKIIDAAYYRHFDNPIDKIIAKAMYGDNLKNSISRLEKFAACAYSHFLKYGLELRERKIFEIKVSDIGSIYHSAIEIFSKLVNDNYDWKNIDDEIRVELVKKSVMQAVEESGVEALSDNARNKYMIERVENMTDKTTKVLCKQLENGKFEPEYFEFRFSPQEGAKSMCMKLADDTNMNLTGIIDRVDVYRETDENGDVKKVYLKIIDYKSGNKDFKIEDVFDGRQLQLSMYMRAMIDVEQEKYPDAEIIPAAELYYNIKDPYIEKYNEDGIDDSEARREQEYRMPGLVNNDEEILGLLDADIIEKGNSQVIKVSRLKNGMIKVPKGTSTKGFDALGNFIVSKATELGKDIMNGNVSVTPYKSGTSTPCDYCEFSSVCRFDMKLSGFEYRDVLKQKSEEIWNEIMKYEGEVREDGN